MYHHFRPKLLLELVDDNKDAAVSLIELFIELTPKDIEILKELASKGEWEKVGKTAHKMKSGINTIGLTELAAKIILIEKHAADREDVHSIPLLIEEVSEHLQMIYKEMQMFINSHSE